VLVDSAADDSAAAATWAASHAADAAADVPVSSFKGVEYLPAEKRWQAYVLDKALSEVRGSYMWARLFFLFFGERGFGNVRLLRDSGMLTCG
jgi:hypothetical protein